eukprot:TRINITY_DN5113_c0_g1_i3.p3 TRINITY_DN5113_c0_g1~~TRINITY_DN5113_c0_g1_i3.p3  ORF type:complete len:181 (+),score=28.58 TRINITY_DN5113_c0_g1_i3:200-742(+)
MVVVACLLVWVCIVFHNLVGLLENGAKLKQTARDEQAAHARLDQAVRLKRLLLLACLLIVVACAIMVALSAADLKSKPKRETWAPKTFGGVLWISIMDIVEVLGIALLLYFWPVVHTPARRDSASTPGALSRTSREKHTTVTGTDTSGAPAHTTSSLGLSHADVDMPEGDDAVRWGRPVA